MPKIILALLVYGDEYPAVYLSKNSVSDIILPKLGSEWRLPSSTEWEYACYGGGNDLFYWGKNENEMGLYANVCDLTSQKFFSLNSSCIDTVDGFPKMAPVGSLKENFFGLKDMIGNVWEICADGKNAFICGGAWCNRQLYFFHRPLCRVQVAKNEINYMIGFRLCRILNQKTTE